MPPCGRWGIGKLKDLNNALPHCVLFDRSLARQLCIKHVYPSLNSVQLLMQNSAQAQYNVPVCLLSFPHTHMCVVMLDKHVLPLHKRLHMPTYLTEAPWLYSIYVIMSLPWCAMSENSELSVNSEANCLFFQDANISVCSEVHMCINILKIIPILSFCLNF